MSLSNNFPNLKPTLLLDFANTKQLDPRITFTRASTATYYDGVTVAKAEENLLLQSQDFNVTWNTPGLTITANTTVAPDGTTTADTLTGDGTAVNHNVNQGLAATTSNRTVSVYAKAGTQNFIQFYFATDAAPFANFNITAGAGAVGSVGTGITASIVDAGNGWYRCIATITSTTATGLNIGFISSATAARAEAVALSTTVFLWGAQGEQRSSVTAYTATTTQPITNYIPVLLTAAAGVARFDHNPTTDESLGLLIEESRTNLLTYSAQFDNAAWTKFASSVTANSSVAPDGNITADTLIADGTSALHRVEQTVTAGSARAMSIYAKAGTNNFIQILFGGDVAPWANFDLSAGVVGSVGSNQTASIQAVGNGWYRCVVYTASTTASNVNVAIVSSASAARGESNSLTTNVFIWGAQVEAGSFATSYIPTVASQVTRSADAASMTGTNFSSWYSAAEGTLYAEMAQFVANTQMFPVGFIGASSDQISLYFPASSALGLYVVNGGTPQANMSSSGNSVPANVFGKVAGAYRANDFALCVLGSTAQTDTSGTIPVVSNLTFRSSGSFLVKKFAYYPMRLTNTQIQALTT